MPIRIIDLFYFINSSVRNEPDLQDEGHQCEIVYKLGNTTEELVSTTDRINILNLHNYNSLCYIHIHHTFVIVYKSDRVSQFLF